jgi:hypothetical protein
MPSFLEGLADKFFVSVLGILVFVFQDDDEELEEGNSSEELRRGIALLSRTREGSAVLRGLNSSVGRCR